MLGLLIGLGLGATAFGAGIRIVRPTELGVVERLGKFRDVKDQGFNWIIPVIDQMRKINTTEQMTHIKPRDMITKDNLNIQVDMVVYYKVIRNNEAVKRSLYNVDNFDYQIVTLAQTTARNIIGTMNFEEVNSKRGELNTRLQIELGTQTENWGVEVVRVELQEITPPQDVQNTMNEIIKANNKKVAAKDIAEALETEADGEKRAAIKKSEGRKQADILEAQGKSQAIKTIAEARAEEIKVVSASLETNFQEKAQLYKKLETVEKALANNSKIIVGTDKDVSLVLSDMAETVLPIKKGGQ